MKNPIVQSQVALSICAMMYGLNAHAVEVDYTLSLGANIAIESSDQVQKAQIFAKPQILFESENWNGEVRALAKVNLDDSLNPTGLDTAGYSNHSKPLEINDAAYLDVQEAWVNRKVGEHSEIRMGKQILNWGALDELRVLDVINPQQFREFVFEDLNSTKLGLLGLTLDTDFFKQQLTLFVSTDQTVHESPAQDSPFLFKASELRFGFPFIASANRSIKTDQQEPDVNTYALRVKGQSESLDYSFVAFSGPDYNPVASLQFSGAASPPTLVREFGKRDFVGFGASTTVDSAILRTEYGFYSKRSVNTFVSTTPLPTLDVLQSDQHLIAVGVDQQFSGNLLVTAQWLIDKLAEDDASLIRQQVVHLATLGFRKPFLNERLTVKGRWAFTDSGSDGLVQISTDYALSDSQILKVGLDVAYGQQDQLFGQFADRSRLKFEYEHYLN